MFQEQIRRRYDHLSRSYRKVADFLLTDYRAAAFMTAAGLAEAVGVDTTTVVRFAQRLDYPGFPELIEEVQQQVKRELDCRYLTEETDTRVQARIQRRVLEDRGRLDRALAYNTPDNLEILASLLRAAEQIIVLGESYAAPLAESFAAMLGVAGLPARYVGGDAYERARALARLTDRDVIVGISPLSGASGVARALSFARDEGAKTLAGTPNPASEAARSAEFLLCAPGETNGAVSSLAGLYSLCAAIANALGEEQQSAAGTRAAEVSRALERLA